MASSTDVVFDTTDLDFDRDVVAASRDVPVVVDFWATWCGPCRTLTPLLEEAVRARGGTVRLAKVDTDANPQVSASFGVRSIPTVIGFRDGRGVDQFVGAQPRRTLEAFLDQLLPSAADIAVREQDEEALRRALSDDPRHLEARLTLGRLLLARGAYAEAVEALRQAEHDPVGAGLLARAELAHQPQADPEAAAALALLDQDPEAAIAALVSAVRDSPSERKDRLRRVLIGVFSERGAADPLVERYRRQLARALY
jgi:putative thioredoxin